MTLVERLADAQQRSVHVYLQRQRIEEQRQMAQQQAQIVDRELLLLDGEIRLLTALVAEKPDGQ